MFKSIFAKQFILYISILFFSFISLFFGLSVAFNAFFTNKTVANLEKQAERIVESLIYSRGFLTPRDIQTFKDEFYLVNKYLDVSLIFVDTNFNIIASAGIESNLVGVINIPELNPVMEANTVNIKGKLGNIFTAYPLISNSEIVIGAILLNSPVKELQQSIFDLAKSTFAISIISASIAFIFIYISSLQLTKPLKLINNAANIIAGGDFEKRLKVSSKDEIGELCESFNYMAESLQNQEVSRIEFISNISHDIRTPLTSMRGFLQAMLDGTVKEEKKNHYLNIVMEETIRLSKMANDLLDLNKIQTLKVKIEKTDFDINELIRKTMFVFEERIIDQAINIIIKFNSEKNIVLADYDKIQRVIYNLVDNAIKFIDVNPTITIETYAEKNKLYVKIKDNGPGLSKDEMNKVFNRFYKCDESRGGYNSGSGLGLSIVKVFVEAHDEKIIIVDKNEKGCEFIFSMTLC
jgi:signal transduction histidine kinase